MGVSLDYVITRAVGIKNHLLIAQDYNRLVSGQSISELIDYINPRGYARAIAKYYTPSDAIPSLTRAIFETVDDRWRKIIGWAEDSLLQRYNKYREIIDLKNMVALLMFVVEAKLKIEDLRLITRLTPGGSIPLHIWQEIFSEPSYEKISVKSLILAPEISEMINHIGHTSDFASFEFFSKIMKLINQRCIGSGWSSSSRLHMDPVNLVILDFINRLLIRFIQGETSGSILLENLAHLILPWSEINWLVGTDVLEKSTDMDAFSASIMDLLEGIAEEKQSFERYKPRSGEAEQHWEDIIAHQTLLQLQHRSKGDYNDYLLALVLYQTIVEGKNLVWLAFAMTHNMSNEMTRGGLVYP